MNGRRLVMGSPLQGAIAPDLNQIPGALVENVELLTGGASATYGSDAVAGVVNFIMKDDFEGVKLDYQHSFYQYNNPNSNDVAQSARDANFDLAPGSGRDGHMNDFSIIWGSMRIMAKVISPATRLIAISKRLHKIIATIAFAH